MHRLEAISIDIHFEFEAERTRAKGGSAASHTRGPYALFQERAYTLLRYFLQNEFTAAFEWYLKIREDPRKRPKGDLEDHPFHWGLRAMSVARKSFMHRNKLRDLADDMRSAYAADVDEGAFVNYRRHLKRTRRDEAAAEIGFRQQTGFNDVADDDDSW